MRYLALLLAFTLFVPFAYAKEPEKVEIEKLMPLEALDVLKDKDEKDDKSGKDDAKEDEKPATPEEQALMICQAAEIVGQKLQSAEYQPGVDAYGKPVDPADVYSQPAFDIPDQVDIPISIDVMAALGINNPPTEGKAKIGTLTLFKDGNLEYNGRNITDKIEGYCKTHVKKMEEKK